MATESELQKAANQLYSARKNGISCCRVSEMFNILSLEDAYEVQEQNTERALEEGRVLTGRKVGLTSEAVQKQLGVDQPDFGMLFDDMEYSEGSELPTANLIQPKVEAELAFILKSDLTAERLSLNKVVQAIDFVLPALEVVDSAIENWRITLPDTVADNASSGLYVLGSTPFSLKEVNLALEGMLLEINGKAASLGIGAACLGNPLNACLWLARTMVKHGRPLRAGDVVLSGALGPMVSVSAGDEVRMKTTRFGELHCAFK